MTEPRPNDAEFPRPPWRQRLLILVLALVTANGVTWLVMRPPKPVHLPPQSPAAEPARCAPGQESSCLGGSSAVFAVPPAGASGAGR